MDISNETLTKLFIDEDRTLNDVATILGISIPALRGKLRKAGITKTSRINYTTEEVERIVRLFTEENMTAEAIAQEFNTTVTKIRNILTYRSITKSRDQKRRSSIDKSKINKLDPEFYYFLGWFLTDGSIKNSTVRFNLQARDVEVLEVLARFFGYDPLTKVKTCKHHEEKNQPLRVLYLSSTDLVEYLVTEFKIPLEDKTHNLRLEFEFPNDDCFRLFLRGVFEGDGCLTIKRFSEKNRHLYSVLCSASRPFLEDLNQFIESRVGVRSSIYEGHITQKSGKISTYYTLNTTCRQAFNLFTFVYEGFPHLRLDRKFQKYHESIPLYLTRFVSLVDGSP